MTSANLPAHTHDGFPTWGPMHQHLGSDLFGDTPVVRRYCLAMRDEPGDLFPATCVLAPVHELPHRAKGFAYAGGSVAGVEWP